MYRPSLTSDKLIQRAAELADAHGFSSVTLSEVARSFEVKTPSLYSHVRDLAALRDGVTILAMGELTLLIAERTSGRVGREALGGFADAHRMYVRDHPGRWEALQRRAGVLAVDHPVSPGIVHRIDALLDGYRIPVADRVHATRLVGAAVSGFLNLERVGSFDHSAPPPEESWPVLLDALHVSLSLWSRQNSQSEEDA